MAPRLGFPLGVHLSIPPNVTLSGFCQGLRFAHPLPMKHSLFAPLPAFQQEGAFFFGTVFPVRFPKVGGGSSTQKNIDQGAALGRHGAAATAVGRISGDPLALSSVWGSVIEAHSVPGGRGERRRTLSEKREEVALGAAGAGPRRAFW